MSLEQSDARIFTMSLEQSDARIFKYSQPDVPSNLPREVDAVRIAIIVASVLLLGALVPVGPGMAKQKFMKSDEGTIVVDNDFYAHVGWWDSSANMTADGTEQENIDDTTTNPETGHTAKPVWLWLNEITDERGVWELLVRTEGPVIAAVDVFKVEDNGDSTDFLTPKCVHHPVTDLYPEDGQSTPSYVSRLLRLTVGSHVLVAPGGTGFGTDDITFRLDPDNAPRGYIVSIYPLAASNHNNVTGEAYDDQSPEIYWNLTATRGKMFYDPDANTFQKTTPYSLSPILTNLNGCTSLQNLPGPPPLPNLGPGAIPELPGQADEWFENHLPV